MVSLILAIPEPGQLVDVRQRRYVVTDISQATLSSNPLKPPHSQHLISLASVEDDNLGEELQVIWEVELGVKVTERNALPIPTGFDTPERLDTFLNAVRWGAVSSTDIKSLQAPFRSGVEMEDYCASCTAKWMRQ